MQSPHSVAIATSSASALEAHDKDQKPRKCLDLRLWCLSKHDLQAKLVHHTLLLNQPGISLRKHPHESMNVKVVENPATILLPLGWPSPSIPQFPPFLGLLRHGGSCADHFRLRWCSWNAGASSSLGGHLGPDPSPASGFRRTTEARIQLTGSIFSSSTSI